MAPVTGTPFTGTSDLDIDVANAQYVDNRDYHGDITKARLFIKAIAYLKTHRAQIIAQSGSSLSFAEMDAEERRVEEYISWYSSRMSKSSFTRGRARL